MVDGVDGEFKVFSPVTEAFKMVSVGLTGTTIFLQLV